MATKTKFKVPPTITAKRAAQFFKQPAKSTFLWATYEFAIRGLTPILLDRMTDEQILGLATGNKVDYPKDEPLETKALRKMYSDAYKEDMPAGAIGVPRTNLNACFRDAGTEVQYGSGKFDKITFSTKGTKFYTMVRLLEPFYPLLGPDGKTVDWEVDLRKGNATQGSGAVGIIRGIIPEWLICGHLDLNVDLLSEAKLTELISKAGVNCGLCSGRPGNQMEFGQFALVHLKWIGGADPKKTIARTPTANGKKKAPRKKRTPTNRVRQTNGKV